MTARARVATRALVGMGRRAAQWLRRVERRRRRSGVILACVLLAPPVVRAGWAWSA